MMIKYIEDSINEAAKLFAEFAEDKSQLEFIKQISEVIVDVFKTGNKVLICGNGGSATDAMHFAEECTGRFRKDRKALP
ncbi:MAG: phosphoheptose isomerase, partial [Candidatus Cloacimonadota bacterium]